MKAKGLLIVYFVVLVIEMIGEAISQSAGTHWFIWLLKPLLMPLLMLWYYKQTKAEHKFDKILLASLFFSWWGDNFLMPDIMNPAISFLLGLGSFLIAHLLYIFAFTLTPKNDFNLIKSKPFLALPFVLLVFGLLYLLNFYNLPDFSAMKIPVIVYATVIMFMVLAALNRFNKVPSASYKWVMMGAVLFMVSDSIIALSRFSPLFENTQTFARIAIMSLYAAGQFLIAKGCVLQYDRRN